MNSHPGGQAHTQHMLDVAALPLGARILDLGAGAGEAVATMRALGFEAEGIDLIPRSDLIRQGNLLHTDYSDSRFDAVFSQCAFFVSGDAPQALREAHRLLKTGGILLLSDVFFDNPLQMLRKAGFDPVLEEDLTPQWREYYLEALWRDDVLPCSLPAGKCRYCFITGRKY